MSEIAEQLLKIALNDIKAAEKLFDAKLFPQAVFYFQQATEKTFKGWGIFNGIIKEDELEKISHKQIKIYWKAVMEQEENLRNAIKAYESIEGAKEHEVYKDVNFEEYNKMIEGEKAIKLLLERLDLLNLNHTDHIYILDHLKEIEQVKLPSFKNTAGKLGEYSVKTESFTRLVNEKGANEFREGIDNFNNEQLEALTSYILNAQLLATFISKVLFFTSVISSIHISHSRYPKNGLNPLEFYSCKQPIVKYLPDYLRLVRKAIRNMEKLRAGKYQPKVLEGLI